MYIALPVARTQIGRKESAAPLMKKNFDNKKRRGFRVAKYKRLSLQSRSARRHLHVALTLVLILPLLSMILIVGNEPWENAPLAFEMQIAFAFSALLLALLGYSMLRKYPRDIEMLHEHLKSIAEGHLPDKVHLGHDTDEAIAIADCLNRILAHMRQRMKKLEEQIEISEQMGGTIREQARQLTEAERNRVMLDSFGTACHYLGQPATVLEINLSLLKNKLDGVQDSEAEALLHSSREAIESMGEILHKLNAASNYRTVSYLSNVDDSRAGEGRLIKI